MTKFVSTPEQDAALAGLIAEHKSVPGTLITVLQQAQRIYGWLPMEVMKTIADGLELPLSQVVGVESFYTFFHNKPYGKYIIRMCKSAPCHISGAAETLAAFEKELGIKVGETTEDGKFSLLTCDCLGVCDRAPAVLIDDEVYGPVSAGDIPALLAKFE